MLPRIGRLIDSHTDGVIDKTEFEPRVVGLRQRLSQLQERHRAQRLKELESRSTLRVAWGGCPGSVAAAAEGARTVLVRLRVRYRPTVQENNFRARAVKLSISST